MRLADAHPCLLFTDPVHLMNSLPTDYDSKKVKTNDLRGSLGSMAQMKNMWKDEIESGEVKIRSQKYPTLVELLSPAKAAASAIARDTFGLEYFDFKLEPKTWIQGYLVILVILTSPPFTGAITI